MPSIEIVTAVTKPLAIPISTANLPTSKPVTSEATAPTEDAAHAITYRTERLNSQPPERKR